MPGFRILLGCLLLVVVGCANGAKFKQQMDALIGVLTYDQAVADMKGPPVYKCEGDEGIVAVWIHHWSESRLLPPMSSYQYVEIPHGRHTHLVFDRKTRRLTQWGVKQW